MEGMGKSYGEKNRVESSDYMCQEMKKGREREIQRIKNRKKEGSVCAGTPTSNFNVSWKHPRSQQTLPSRFLARDARKQGNGNIHHSHRHPPCQASTAWAGANQLNQGQQADEKVKLFAGPLDGEADNKKGMMA